MVFSMKVIVTVKIKAQPDHNPRAKQIGTCPIGESNGQICTDITGGHHSFIDCGDSISEIRDKIQQRGHHVTRIEEIDDYA